MPKPTKKVSRHAREEAPTPSDSTAKSELPVPGFKPPVVRLSIEQAAARAGNCGRTIKRWIKAGYLPATRQPSPKGMGHLRVRLSDLESLIARGAVS